jgi:hypothetical protein
MGSFKQVPPINTPFFEAGTDSSAQSANDFGGYNPAASRRANQETGSFPKMSQEAMRASHQSQAQGPEAFVEAEAAAEFLHYSPRSVRQMARENRIPAHPFGDGPRKKWYFLLSELAENLRSKVNCGDGESGRDKRSRRTH